MDTICETKGRVHQGLNIRRIRAASQMKQEIFADKMCIAQSTASKYENQEVVDEEILERAAKVLDVPVEVLKYMPMDDSAPVQIFKDVTFNDSPSNNNVLNQEQTNNYNNSPETLAILKETVDMLKAELKMLREENSKLRGNK